MSEFQAQTKEELQMTYRAVGSGTGQREFSQVSDGDYSGSLSDFGAGDIPMSQTRYDGIQTAGREMVHVPFSLGAIGVFHSVPVESVGADGLKLSACTLAKIFNGTITTWDHADIMAENPNLLIPAGETILVGHRALGSSSTGGLTGYMFQECPDSWKLEVGSTVTWPNQANFKEVQGSPGMTDHIAMNSFAIGYLDAGHGHQRNFQEVMLQNKANTWLTSSDALAASDNDGLNGVEAAGAAGIAANVVPSAVTDDWSGVALYNMDGTNTWPIVLVSYIYVNKDISGMAPENAALLKAFVDYVTTADKGQALLAEFSFSGIPSVMNKWPDTWDNVLIKPATLNATHEHTFETSTLSWVGQGANVISEKRDDFINWKLGDMEVQEAALLARIEAIESSLSDYGMVPLHGSGTTNPRNWFNQVMKETEHRARVPMLLTYRAVGSGTGQREFVGQESNGWQSYSHFGAGDIPMSSTNYQAILAAGHSMLHLPFALGAIGIFYNIPSDDLGGGRLQLTACLLAKIFSGTITTWDHAEILAVNPTLLVPANTAIQVGHRTLGSSSTGGLAGYLNEACPNDWLLGTGSTLPWPAPPSHSNFKAVQGSPGMQSHIANTDYSIGYLDAGYGHDFLLSEVALTNKDGQTRTSLESMALGGIAAAGDAGVTANRFPVDPTADWSSVNLYNMAGAHTWPIVLVSYMYVKKDQTSTHPRTAAALQFFIDTILRDPETLSAEFGFTAPSTQLRQLSLDAASTILYPSSLESFWFEQSTTAYDGMAASTISVKREAYDDYERALLTDQINALRTRIEAIPQIGRTTTTTPTTSTTSTTSTTTGWRQLIIVETRNKKTVDDSLDTIALVISIVMIVVASIALGVSVAAYRKISDFRALP